MMASTIAGTVPGEGSRDLDAQIALRVGGYRWVEWNHTLLCGAPLDAPGRFLAPHDHVLAHLHVAARSEAALAEHPLELVPLYSTDLNWALAAAAVAGLFRHGAVLRQTASDTWCIETSDPALRLEGDRLPALICQAILDYVDRVDKEPSTSVRTRARLRPGS